MVTLAVDLAASPAAVVHSSEYMVVPESPEMVSRLVASLPIAKSLSFFFTVHDAGFILTDTHDTMTALPFATLFGCTRIIAAESDPLAFCGELEAEVPSGFTEFMSEGLRIGSGLDGGGCMGA